MPCIDSCTRWATKSPMMRNGTPRFVRRILSGSGNRTLADCTICVAAGVSIGVMFCLVSINSEESLVALAHTSAMLGAAFGLPMGVGFWYRNRLFKRTGKWY
jgi:hypothetical protein